MALLRIFFAWSLILLTRLTLAEESSILDGAAVTNANDFDPEKTPDPNILIGVGFKSVCLTRTGLDKFGDGT